MLHDLAAVTTSEPISRDAQICVIGAGTAGLFFAQRLRELGVQVLLLEAGGRDSRSPSEMGQQCEQRGIQYRGAESGRAFGLGGTSVLWGGQFIPLTPEDIGSRTAAGFDAWPLGYEELEPFFNEVRQVLGLVAPTSLSTSDRIGERFRALATLDADLVLRVSEWLPFRYRNFAKAFTGTVEGDPELQLWLNATVTGLEVTARESEHGVREVLAEGPQGQRLRVRAKQVVVSAGALESTRLLLELFESLGEGRVADPAPMGRYFADHLSVTVGKFRCANCGAFNHAVAPVFERGIMRTPRLELSAKVQARESLASAFAHFTFITDGNSGFDFVRNWLRKRQGEGVALGITPVIIGKALRDVSALAYWKTVHRRLWIPRDAELLLQVDVEQFPNWDSRLMLTDERDEYGRKRLSIDWRIRQEDLHVVRSVAEKVTQAWQRSALAQTADLVSNSLDQLDDFATLYDVYHPTGALRMGTNRENSVVDSNLRLWGFHNCYVSTTAVFPSAGSANPGYTHLALSARLAKHLAVRIRG